MTDKIVNEICNTFFHTLPTKIIRNNVGLAGYVYTIQICGDKYVLKISDDKKNYIRSDPRGFNVYSKVINGKEYWVHERNGIIQNGGVNTKEFYYHKKGGKK